MKKLSQDIFIGQPEWVKSAAVDGDGEVYLYSIGKCDLMLSKNFPFFTYKHIDGATCDYVNDGFDATNWQNSAIDRL